MHLLSVFRDEAYCREVDRRLRGRIHYEAANTLGGRTDWVDAGNHDGTCGPRVRVASTRQGHGRVGGDGAAEAAIGGEEVGA